MSTSKVIPVVAAVRWRNGKLWVCRRTDDGSHGGLAGMWEYPGGKQEEGENLYQAMHREMKEEFDVEIVIERYIDTITSETWGNLYEVTFYQVEFLEIPILKVHDDAQWYSPEQVVTLNHLPSGKEFNRRFLAYSRFQYGGLP